MKPKGNSMSPRIKSGERICIVQQLRYEVDDVVFCKVKGRYMVHLIAAYNPKRGYQITNLKGHVNGWSKTIYGKAFKPV